MSVNCIHRSLVGGDRAESNKAARPYEDGALLDIPASVASNCGLTASRRVVRALRRYADTRCLRSAHRSHPGGGAPVVPGIDRAGRLSLRRRHRLGRTGARPGSFALPPRRRRRPYRTRHPRQRRPGAGAGQLLDEPPQIVAGGDSAILAHIGMSAKLATGAYLVVAGSGSSLRSGWNDNGR